MRYFSTLLLTLCCCFVLFSCGSKRPRYVIGVSQCSDDEWRHQQNTEILREAGFYHDLQVNIRTAKDDSRQQVEDIRRFIHEGVDLLVVSPNEAEPITPVVEEAYDKGIPVIVVDRKILSDKYTAYIGADNYGIGYSIGNYVASILDGKGSVIEIAGLSGSTPAIDRHAGFSKAISAWPDIKVLAVVDGAWLRDQAEAKMDSLLDVYPQFDVLYAHNDRMADGAYTAALSRGREKHIRFIGTDALSGESYGLESVLAGKLSATFIYPTGGDKVVETAMNILTGRAYERELNMNTSVVDSTNAPIMQLQTAHIAVLDDKIETLSGRVNRYLELYSTQKVVLLVSLAALLLLVGMLAVVYLSLRAKNRMNRELSRQKQMLEAQKQRLEEQTRTLEAQKNTLERQKGILQQQKDQLEQLSHELEEATHAKLVFFTNISHDFRTPLTLISDPVEQLLADKSVQGEHRQLLELVRKNVRILLNLVNQILDFRKVENGRMELQLKPMDLRASFLTWNESFRMTLLRKHIRFSFKVEGDDSFRTMADVGKMERIYFNLLSNAVKYTPEKGEISIRLTAGEGEYVLSVFNSGSYISPQEVEAIFERFYQVDGSRAGTGIGLALVHAFVEMQGGHITAGSDEQGTTFTVTFPKHEVPDQVEVEPVQKATLLPLISSDAELTEEEQADPDAPIVLVIDDNADIRSYVSSLLSNEYRVLTAADGQTGLRLATRYVPDVVICDVMMPGMDGIECCRRLKSEVQTSHIPVILLTACSLDEQRIQGYDGGADSYISKPFNSQLLVSRIRNLLANRYRLKQFFGDNPMIEKGDINDVDRDFVTRFRTLVEGRMRDASLNVEELGRDMGMSRVQLYRKLKSLTNFSPNELLRHMRLRKAASLLVATNMTVAEVAYEVGFSSPSYFTKCYKEEFGESPTEKRKK